MASVELLYIDKDGRGRQSDPPCVLDWASNPVHVRKASSSAGGALSISAPDCEGLCNSAPRTVPHNGNPDFKHSHPAVEKVRVCCDEELETSFTYVDENVNLRLASPGKSGESIHNSGCRPNDCPEGLHELSLMSDDDLASESSGASVDYGFISAVTFLVTGISLVIISYAVPREVKVDPESVSAREMERLEIESARVGAHLDRCVIAGLCLLTLGGVVLSTLLMISIWKGEMYRRKSFAYSKHSAKRYGSINFKTRSSPCRSSPHLSMKEEIDETLN
ncbi:transmembrane protein 74-like [Coregonus clupeaformis]|uniref:transmembrane protein 74-like n=1 Tax=Coregonus clupeaformis TaxID=59861 RepID=UPI001BE0261D|nr:transmembrane protein 74-like [Coregonus clupeaformis]